MRMVAWGFRLRVPESSSGQACRNDRRGAGRTTTGRPYGRARPKVGTTALEFLKSVKTLNA